MSVIYNDIEKSDYVFKYDKLHFYFSSKFYLEKFERLYKDFIKDETMKLKIKFKCNIYCDDMILLLLYKKIEKRGFKVLCDDKVLIENYYMKLDIDELSKR